MPLRSNGNAITLEERPYHWIGLKVSVAAVSYSTGKPSANTTIEWTLHPTLVRLAARNNTKTTRGFDPTPCGGEVLHVCKQTCIVRNTRCNNMSHLAADAVFVVHVPNPHANSVN